MVAYVGIDPGLSGAVAILVPDVSVVAQVMPVIQTVKGKSKVRRIDPQGLRQLIRSLPQPCYAVIEAQQAGHLDGKGQVFTTGEGFGRLLQALADHDIPHEIIQPKEWQKVYGITGTGQGTKGQALQVVQRLFPTARLLATLRSKVPHDGMVDAILMAEVARRRHGGE